MLSSKVSGRPTDCVGVLPAVSSFLCGPAREEQPYQDGGVELPTDADVLGAGRELFSSNGYRDLMRG